MYPKHQLFCAIFLCATLSSCVSKIDFDPALPGAPSGGISGVEITNISGAELSFCVDLFVVDHFGGFVKDLDGNCLNYENTDGSELILVGLEQRVTPEKGPYSAQMLFDQSGSINSTDPEDARIDAGVGFVDVMSGSDEASVAVFSGSGYPMTTSRLTPFTRDKSLLRSQIEDMAGREGGGTPLYSSITGLLDEVDTEANNDNKALVVFTDGRSGESTRLVSNLIAEAVTRSIEVYTVGLGGNVDQDVLAGIALNTGGSVMYAEEVTQLISLYQSLGELLRGGNDVYNVCYTVSVPSRREWQSGDAYTVNLRLTIPTGEIINFPVFLFVP